MKIQKLALLISAFAVAGSVHAQPNRMGTMFGGGMSKLFGDNSAFTADLELQSAMSVSQTMTMPAKMAFDSGKLRFEMNFGDIKGGQMPPGMAQQMKTMGMDRMISISRPDSKTGYIIYPGLSAYAVTPIQDAETTKPPSAFKIQMTELGKETVDGHPTVKNKAVVTDDEGKTHEFTVWNATDLNKFPVKIEMNEQGQNATMLFSNVKTTKPDASLFDPPSDYKKYNNQQDLMQGEVMKHMPGGMPGHP